MNKLLSFCILLSSIFVLSTVGFSQEIELTNEVQEIRNPLLGSWNGKLVFQEISSSGGLMGYNDPDRFVSFTILDTKTNTEKQIESLPTSDKANKSSFQKSFIHEDFIFESHLFRGKNDFYSIGIVKRSIEDGNQVGETILLNQSGEIKEIKYDENGFYVLLNQYADGYIVFRVNYNLEIVWERQLELLKSINNTVSSVSLDEDQNLLISVLMKEEVKTNVFGKGPEPKTGLAFIFVDSEGEISNIAPQLPSDMAVKSFSFKFYPEKQELVGIFIIEPTSDPKFRFYSGIGYVYVKWNSEGEIVTTNEYVFTPKDIESQNFTDYLELTKINVKTMMKDGHLHDVALIKPLKFIFMDNQDVVVATQEYFYGEPNILQSKFIFSVANSGNLNWTKFIPYGQNDNYKHSDYFEKDGKLHLYIREFSRNFEGGTYNFKYFRDPITPASIQFCDLTINLETGVTESYKPILPNIVDNFLPNIIVFNNNLDQVVLRYSKTIKNLERYLILNFNEEEE